MGGFCLKRCIIFGFCTPILIFMIDYFSDILTLLQFIGFGLFFSSLYFLFLVYNFSRYFYSYCKEIKPFFSSRANARLFLPVLWPLRLWTNRRVTDSASCPTTFSSPACSPTSPSPSSFACPSPSSPCCWAPWGSCTSCSLNCRTPLCLRAGINAQMRWCRYTSQLLLSRSSLFLRLPSTGDRSGQLPPP